MFEKPFGAMTDDELREELVYWNEQPDYGSTWWRDITTEITNVLKVRENLRREYLSSKKIKFGPQDDQGTRTVAFISIVTLLMYWLMLVFMGPL